jgi:CheY-like chemotaxis protein
MVARSAGGRRRVLVVEDHADGAESLRLLLSLWGYEVRLAATGPQGLSLAREWRPDAVLSDIGLPGLDGCRLAEALSHDPATAHITLLAMSGYGDEATRRRAGACGFTAVLTKPIDPAALRALLGEP